MTSSLPRIVAAGLASALLALSALARADAGLGSCEDPCTLDECPEGEGEACDGEVSEDEELELDGMSAEEADAFWEAKREAFEACERDHERAGWEFACGDYHGESYTVYCQPSSGCAMSTKNKSGLSSALVAFGAGIAITAYRVRRSPRSRV